MEADGESLTNAINKAKVQAISKFLTTVESINKAGLTAQFILNAPVKFAAPELAFLAKLGLKPAYTDFKDDTADDMPANEAQIANDSNLPMVMGEDLELTIQPDVLTPNKKDQFEKWLIQAIINEGVTVFAVNAK